MSTGLGQTDSFLSLVDRFVQVWSHDHAYRPEMLSCAAEALSIGGQHDQAIRYLEELSPLKWRAGKACPATLDQAFFDFLHDNPRFEALVKNWERKE